MQVREMLGWLISPHVFEVAALFIAGIGVALALSSERGDVTKAHYFFAAAFLLTFGRVAQLLLQWHESEANKYIATFFLFGSLGVAWLAVYVWVDNKLSRVPTETPAVVQPQPLSAPEAA